MAACLLQKKKKLRKKDTAEELAFLEEEAAAAGGNATDHGSRAARATLADTRTAERDQAAALKQQRCVTLSCRKPADCGVTR